MIYWRVNYKNIGIYEALKKEIWKKSKYPKEEWEKLKNSEAFMWLKTPPIAYDNYHSYFTELGYKTFIKKTYPVLTKYLNKKDIKVDNFIFDDSKLNIVYKDEHQSVIEK